MTNMAFEHFSVYYILPKSHQESDISNRETVIREKYNYFS